MKIKIKRIDAALPLPEYKTPGAAAFDLYTRENITIPAGGWNKAPSNFIIQTPPGHALVISARSSLAKHYPGLFLANGVGLVDNDYCGPTDEILISLYNFSNKDILIEKGARIAQAFVIKINQMQIEEMQKIAENNRGGFGSTGKN